jgi:hypothetical protein
MMPGPSPLRRVLHIGCRRVFGLLHVHPKHIACADQVAWKEHHRLVRREPHIRLLRIIVVTHVRSSIAIGLVKRICGGLPPQRRRPVVGDPGLESLRKKAEFLTKFSENFPQGLKPTFILRRFRHATHPLGGCPARALIQNFLAIEFFSKLWRPALHLYRCCRPLSTSPASSRPSTM